jgi:hypothetical protein
MPMQKYKFQEREDFFDLIQGKRLTFFIIDGF